MFLPIGAGEDGEELGREIGWVRVDVVRGKRGHGREGFEEEDEMEVEEGLARGDNGRRIPHLGASDGGEEPIHEC